MTMSTNSSNRFIEVPFIVKNVDLENVQHLAIISESLSDLGWAEEAGYTVATAFVSASKPVDEALQVARKIQNSIAGSVIERLCHDLVAVTEVAERVGVSREAVRKWSQSAALGFPVPEAVVVTGAKDPMKVWRWSEVVDWLRSVKRIEMDESYLSRAQAIELEACLNRVHERQLQWNTAVPTSRQVLSEYLGVFSAGSSRGVWHFAEGRVAAAGSATLRVKVGSRWECAGV